MTWSLEVEDSEERPIPLPNGPPVNPFTDSSVMDEPIDLPEVAPGSVEVPLSPEEALSLLEAERPLDPNEAASLLDRMMG